MRYAENIQQVLEIEPDYMGFIFYNMSPRYVGDLWDGPGEEFPATTKKVGVFINESSKRIRALAERYQLDHLQLHGHETPQYCQELFENGYILIKVMTLKVEEDLDNLKNYKPWVKYFLFDTPSKQFGGTGNTFDWSLLEQYHNEVPIFLSGGISLDNLSNVKKLKELNLEAIDVNSRFEIRPGWKDPAMLERLKNQIQEL